MHGFDLYSTYIGNYKHAMETIAKCRNANQQFAAIMDQVSYKTLFFLKKNATFKCQI